LNFGWYFWIGAILTFTTAVSAYFTVPSDVQEWKAMNVKKDWLGSTLIVCGLILVVFATTDSSHAPDGWRTPYIYVPLIAGTIFLGPAVYVEGWIATTPVIPPDLFRVPSLTPAHHRPVLLLRRLPHIFFSERSTVGFGVFVTSL